MAATIARGSKKNIFIWIIQKILWTISQDDILSALNCRIAFHCMRRVQAKSKNHNENACLFVHETAVKRVLAASDHLFIHYYYWARAMHICVIHSTKRERTKRGKSASHLNEMNILWRTILDSKWCNKNITFYTRFQKSISSTNILPISLSVSNAWMCVGILCALPF